MTTETNPSRNALHMDMSEFWSGELGLTLVTLSVVVLIFVIAPLREAGIYGRGFVDIVMVALMILGALTVNQGRIATALVIAVVFVTAAVLFTGRLHPTPLLHQIGSKA